MKIIDAHFHLFGDSPFADEMARAVGHENSVEHLRDYYRQRGIAHGVIMSNHSLRPEDHDYPADLFHYCIGLDASVRDETADVTALVEENLKLERCCGVKLYPGYNDIWLYDASLEPIYALAARYDKPVAIHMGMTAHMRAKLKYSHPLVLDEVAAEHPRCRFVMCHFGNPFLSEAAAVLEKNGNVAADLSGLLEGIEDLPVYFEEQAGYVQLLRTWFQYVHDDGRFLFGTDWPAVNIGNYIEFIQRLLPEKSWDKVFFENANRVYGLGL